MVLQLSAVEIFSVSGRGWCLECTGTTFMPALMLRTGWTPFVSLKFRWGSWVSHCLYLVSYDEALFLNYSHVSCGNRDHCLHCNNLCETWDSCWSHCWRGTFHPTGVGYPHSPKFCQPLLLKMMLKVPSCLYCFNLMKPSTTSLKLWGTLVYPRLLPWTWCKTLP